MTALSIVLLTRDAGPLLAQVLDGISRQDLAEPAEFIAVDSGSRDETRARLAASAATIREIAPADFDFGRTRDLGFELARGEIVITLSQDVVLTRPDALRLLIAPFANPEVAAVSAHLGLPHDRPVFLWQRMGRFYFTREMVEFRARYGKPLSHALSATRRSVWEKLPRSNMPISEDMLLHKRIIEAGYRVAHVDEPLGTHAHDYSLLAASKRCFNEGLGARHLGLRYSLYDLARDLARPDLWLALARQIRYGRLRHASEAVFPALRPVAVFAGHRLGQRYWR